MTLRSALVRAQELVRPQNSHDTRSARRAQNLENARNVQATETQAQDAGESGARERIWSVADRALLALPPIVWLICAWNKRWITDDGLIAARTVRQILAGNGPVFNAGERVEANTSALWTWLIAGVSWISRLDVYKSMMYAGLLLAPLGLLFALLGARKLHKRSAPTLASTQSPTPEPDSDPQPQPQPQVEAGPGRTQASGLRPLPGRRLRLVPVGALVVAALPPFWDFATSGLEESLVFFWLGLCWWLLCGVDEHCTARRAYSTAAVLGLGWLVRPDMAIGTVCFLVGLWFAQRPTRRQAVQLLLTAAALPLAYEIFRMGYYGLFVPNTAVAKEASSANLSTGITYFNNFVTPYHLWVPALLIAVSGATAVNWRGFKRRDNAVVASVVVAAILMLLYVIAIGGDFMHARMLLPGTFLLLCPVSAIPLPALTKARRFAVATAATVGVLAWSILCATFWRLPQPPNYIPPTGITNERAFWTQRVGTKNPVDATPYVRAILGAPQNPNSVAWLLTHADPSDPILLLPGTSTSVQLRLNQPGRSVAIAGDILGTLGAQTPLNGLVIDVHGLSYAFGSHLEPVAGGRVGHDKTVGNAWIVAEYSSATDAPHASPPQVAAARQAFGCGDLQTLVQATTAPMSWSRFWSNVADSYKLTEFRVARDPLQAESALCGRPR